MPTSKCPNCGSSMIPLLTSTVCAAECDLKKPATLEHNITLMHANDQLNFTVGPIILYKTYPRGLAAAQTNYGRQPCNLPGCKHQDQYEDPTTGNIFCYDCGTQTLIVSTTRVTLTP